MRIVPLVLASAVACSGGHENRSGSAPDNHGTKAAMDTNETRTKAPKQEAEQVLNALLPLAKQMLEQHGEFYPFGAAMLHDGSITLVSQDGSDDHPSSQQVIEDLLTTFRAEAKLGTYRVVGIAYAITTVPPGATEKTDAIMIRLDHASGYSVQVVYPYRIVRPGEVVIAEPFATSGPGDVFR